LLSRDELLSGNGMLFPQNQNANPLALCILTHFIFIDWFNCASRQQCELIPVIQANIDILQHE
jgi:hypothetical protein